MFNSLDSSLFYFLNEYLRNPLFDYILPFFSYSLPLLIAVACVIFFFSLYCLKIYGDALWRVLALTITISVSIIVSEAGALVLKDLFGRSRPYENLQSSNYFQENSFSWVKITHSKSEEKPKNREELEIATPLEKENVSGEISENVPENMAKVVVSEVVVPANQPETLSTKIMEDQVETPSSGVIENGVDTSNTATKEQLSPSIILADAEAEGMSLGFFTSNDNLDYPVLTYDIAYADGIFEETTASMPSAFAANVMAVTFIIALLFPKTAPWIYFAPMITGWARVYTGNSYPMDIIIGWIWGILAVAIAWFICEFILRKVVQARRI